MSRRIPVQDAMTRARLAGYSWADIHNMIEQKSTAARGWGYGQGEINSFLGYQDPDAMTLRLMDMLREAPDGGPPAAAAGKSKSGAA